MRADLAEKTFAVLLHGLALRDRRLRGERLNLEREQMKLQGMLGANAGPPWGAAVPAAAYEPAVNVFLGVRYALACWLDELFCPTWPEWDAQKLEFALYGMFVRADHFWAQARLAEASPDPDAHEAFLWCVLLGFRGAKAAEPDFVRQWVQAARTRVLKQPARRPPDVPEQAAVQYTPPLYGERALRRATRRLVLAGVFATPVLVFLCVYLFGR